ncbi:hypothetical protein PHYSODRAFT_560761 [Phytophthora sojae]|uniref:Uncharacterized protein n=1 Tax=Phytophthora sojae (strain P6497) TaxID=1094619 RepID=G4ZM60_PHYSP|nr:hypothetical protein PHYSODRAFT_560761 [Phytophthora sojae]EGZ16267.1 hypothetical protein PHYSODRAFT_560761 [Phytophthora sojae]|eukprot:XP_009530016.1 hypothetical protein PHYSODRAFT_560761 [Phytophthora sojae]
MNNHDQQQQQPAAAVAPAPVAETTRRRRRADGGNRPASKKLTLRPGVVLFDPKDLEGSGGDWRQSSLTVELLEDNQEDDGDDDKDNEEDNQENNDVDAADPDSPTAKRVRLRARVVEEICETEKSYVSDIRTLLDHYIVVLEDNAHPIMQDAQIAVFFNNLRHLVLFNSKLLTDLLEISPVAVVVQCEAEGVGAVFCRYAPLFKLYGGYAKDYEEVAALLQNFGRDTRLGFRKFLENCRERSGSSKPFESLLIMPIQRIPRYKLLLERLSELTPPDHPDAAFLIEAVNRIRATASLINETVRRQENLETVLQAQQKFAGQLSLFTADRRLLKSGKLTKMSTKRQEEVMIHLFNDILLYSGVLITGGYRVRRIVYLHSKAVGVKTELPAAVQALFEQQSRRRIHKDCGFVVTSREKTFILFAETPGIQREWVDAIASAVKDAQKLKQAKRGDSGDADGGNPEACEGPADAAALWVPDEIADVCTICKASFRAYYRRKHHCRRCGTVVCGTCSSGRAPLFVGESSRAERVCTHCFKIIDLVRQIAMHWLSRVVEFRGVLRRRRLNKWTEHYYELRAGVLKQYALETAATSVTPVAQNGNGAGFASSGSGGLVAVGAPTSASAASSPSSSLLSSSASGMATLHESEWVLRRMSSLDRGRVTDAELSMELAQAAGEDREAYLLERRRRQILKEIIRSEESYVKCLGECIRLFVQPLLLRQLEGRQMYRRRQNKRRSSLRSVPVLGAASARSARGHRRAGSSGNIGITKGGGSSSSLHTPTLSTTATPTTKMLVMDADLSIFFSSVDQIYTLNQQLLDHLSRHLEETSATSTPASNTEDGQQGVQRDEKPAGFPGVKVHRAGAIFHAYAPLMQLYTSYASRHSSALTALDSPQFAGFLRELPEEADANRLRRYLNMPVERIPRYKMLLQELLGSTPPEHVDFVPLQSAIRSVDRVASKIEEISERRENVRTLATVSAKVGIDLSGRHFVRDGMLRKVCRSKVQTYYFVLLEDAMVYGRQGGLHKKFRLIDLWECKVAEDTETMPGVITTVVNSNNAFCFYSPLKSFILLTESEQDKVGWTTDIRDCIERNLRGQTHPRRASVRSELLMDNDDDSSSGYELEGGFVIKNGWLNVPTTSSSVGKKPRRLWITLTLQTISLGSTFKTAQPEETIPIELCEVAPLKNEKCFRVQFLHDTKLRTQTTYVFEALSLAEREEWVRALTHCISGGDELDLRRRSLKTATLAPIFMFDKVSNVCTICTHSFAVYRPRHHCRLCGSLVCGNCSRRRWTLSYSSSKKASRVCDSCAESTMSITRSFAGEM